MHLLLLAIGVLVTAVGAVMLAFSVPLTDLAGVALFILDPPVRGAGEEPRTARRIPRRSWFRPRLIALLVLSSAATCVLAGTDIVYGIHKLPMQVGSASKTAVASLSRAGIGGTVRNLEAGLADYVGWFKTRHPDPSRLLERDPVNWRLAEPTS